MDTRHTIFWKHRGGISSFAQRIRGSSQGRRAPELVKWKLFSWTDGRKGCQWEGTSRHESVEMRIQENLGPCTRNRRRVGVRGWTDADETEGWTHVGTGYSGSRVGGQDVGWGTGRYSEASRKLRGHQKCWKRWWNKLISFLISHSDNHNKIPFNGMSKPKRTDDVKRCKDMEPLVGVGKVQSLWRSVCQLFTTLKNKHDPGNPLPDTDAKRKVNICLQNRLQKNVHLTIH